jgi:hypothetical protein
MRITQVDNPAYLKKHMGDYGLYRILLCDDSHGNTGRKHYSARIKPVNNLSVAEFTESIDNPKYGFIKIEED